MTARLHLITDQAKIEHRTPMLMYCSVKRTLCMALYKPVQIVLCINIMFAVGILREVKYCNAFACSNCVIATRSSYYY